MRSFAIEGSNPPIPALCATLEWTVTLLQDGAGWWFSEYLIVQLAIINGDESTICRIYRNRLFSGEHKSAITEVKKLGSSLARHTGEEMSVVKNHLCFISEFWGGCAGRGTPFLSQWWLFQFGRGEDKSSWSKVSWVGCVWFRKSKKSTNQSRIKNKNMLPYPQKWPYIEPSQI